MINYEPFFFLGVTTSDNVLEDYSSSFASELIGGAAKEQLPPITNTVICANDNIHCTVQNYI